MSGLADRSGFCRQASADCEAFAGSETADPFGITDKSARGPETASYLRADVNRG
jgi:hypothetical protein